MMNERWWIVDPSSAHRRYKYGPFVLRSTQTGVSGETLGQWYPGQVHPAQDWTA